MEIPSLSLLIQHSVDAVTLGHQIATVDMHIIIITPLRAIEMTIEIFTTVAIRFMLPFGAIKVNHLGILDI